MGRERGVNEMDRKTAKLLSLMAEYNEGDPKQVQHSLKVHSFAAAIAAQEALDAETADTEYWYTEDDANPAGPDIGTESDYSRFELFPYYGI